MHTPDEDRYDGRMPYRKCGEILAGDFAPYRDELIISTKAGHDMWPGPYGEWGSRKNLLASLDQSLDRVRLDYVDIFYSHRPDPDTPLEETMSALATAVNSGKALYAGWNLKGKRHGAYAYWNRKGEKTEKHYEHGVEIGK